MVRQKFTDLRTKKSFTTDKFKVTTIQTRAGPRRLATTTAPSGGKATRFVKK